jgi:lysozyme
MGLREQLIKHEGLRLKPYLDTEGIPTIGVGHNLNEGISLAVAMFMLDDDISKHTHELERAHPVVKGLDQVRRDVLINMAFNLGVSRLSGFRKMWRAIHDEDWERAADEMMDSKWARQVGRRAAELSLQMRDGYV